MRGKRRRRDVEAKGEAKGRGGEGQSRRGTDSALVFTKGSADTQSLCFVK